MFIRNVILLYIFSVNILQAEEAKCPKLTNNISAHLISDNYYNYEEFLHYSLGKFTNSKEKTYNLNINNKLDLVGISSDIIFGEYNELKKIDLNNKKLITPYYIKDFYKKNNISNYGESENIYPLDLDTFIIISNNKIKNIVDEEDFYNLVDNNKYTLSQSFYSEKETVKFLNYLLIGNDMSYDNPFLESILFNQKKKYSILNKNTFLGDYQEMITSYENKENLYSVFPDGFAYKEKVNFVIYPNSEMVWNKKIGKFENKKEDKISSFFGFSALINNKNGYNYLCHLTRKKSRENILNLFNLGVSPLSVNDVADPSILSEEYKKILNLKNMSIVTIDNNNFFTKQKNFHKDFIRFIINQDNAILIDQSNNY
ncbi:hypothetical protein OAQ08_02665 [Alphaproteobacteria bacterium]|nr:hypothetical protein [Alphaproteobacteria bacterium]